ncbi:hypothetical protein [Adhaeretor mobilis]|uniref:Uncharacterized protein n=1 Tax=Adhaeretor mobilis TaxID=1930276 RepID=A0A517N094_9BACT|nr:hypothetical protein [Adhaeretor mobilis]QDT00562.1 hypothetical protein HG15A2_39000 [Adhaeretor mobilis]
MTRLRKRWHLILFVSHLVFSVQFLTDAQAQRNDQAKGENSLKDFRGVVPEQLLVPVVIEKNVESNGISELARLDGLIRRVEPGDTEERIWDIADGVTPVPSRDAFPLLHEIADKNRQYIEQLESISHLTYIPQLEMGAGPKGFFSALHLRDAARLEITLLLEEGETAEATTLCLACFRIGDKLMQSNGNLNCVKEGYEFQRTSLIAAAQLFINERVSAKAAEQLFQVVNEGIARPFSLEARLCHDFQFYHQPWLASLPRGDDLKQAIDAQLEYMVPEDASPEHRKRVTTELEKRRKPILEMLDSHKEAYNWEATVRLLAKSYESELTQGYPAPEETEKTEDGEVSVWPREISLNPLSTFGGYFGKSFEMPDEAKLAQAKRQLAGVTNPFGKHLIRGLGPDPSARIYRAYILDLSLRSTQLGTQLFRLRRGQLPESLAQVVDDGIIESVPIDPYGGHLKYDATKKIIWSIGPNRINELGKFEPDDARFLNWMRSSFNLEHLGPKLPESAGPKPDDKAIRVLVPGDRPSRE